MNFTPVPARLTPRITANDLARFMVSSDTARLSIIRRSREPKTPTFIRYKDARGPACAFLTDPIRGLNPLVAAIEAMRQRAEDPAESSLRQDDAKQSIAVFQALQGMRNQLAPFTFLAAPKDQPKLVLGGVEVSIRLDLLTHGSARGQDQFGGAILRMTQDDAETDAAKERRRNMGLYVATLVGRHAATLCPSDRQTANRLCLSIDVQHGEVFPAPASNTRRMSDLEAACRMIAAMWETA
jgi:hypothetical protein